MTWSGSGGGGSRPWSWSAFDDLGEYQEHRDMVGSVDGRQGSWSVFFSLLFDGFVALFEGLVALLDCWLREGLVQR